MKKITTKKTKTVKAAAASQAAPAAAPSVPAAPVAAPAPVDTPAPAVDPAPSAVVAPVAVIVEPIQPAPVKKPAVPTTRTTIVAKVDVGFGNSLYIRGEGPGLSWDKGLAMDCVADDQWTITISDALSPILFKLLLNDITWCAGVDYSVEPGGSITTEPTF